MLRVINSTTTSSLFRKTRKKQNTTKYRNDRRGRKVRISEIFLKIKIHLCIIVVLINTYVTRSTLRANSDQSDSSKL